MLLEIVYGCTAGNPLTKSSASQLLNESVVIAIPVAGLPQQLSEEVLTGSRVAQLLGAVTGGGGGSTGRMMASRTAVLCSPGELSVTTAGGPLGLVIVVQSCRGTDDVEDPMAVNRGTVVGNVVLLCLSCAAVVGVAAILATAHGMTFAAALRVVAFPSCLLPVWTVVLPSTATASSQILTGSVSCGTDAICAVVGVVVVAAPFGLLAYLSRWTQVNAEAVPLHHQRPPLRHVRSTITHILAAHWSWKVRLTSNGSESTDAIPKDHPLRHGIVVLREHRCLWNAALDAGVLVVAGMLVTLSGYGGVPLCITATVLTSATYAAQFAICVICKPYATIFNHYFTLFTVLLTLSSAILQLSMFAIDGNHNTADVLLSISLAASIFDLGVIGASALKSATDGYELLHAALKMFKCNVPVKPTAVNTTMEDATSTVLNTTLLEKESTIESERDSAEALRQLLDDEPLHEVDVDVNPHDLESLFWDHNGNARVLGHEGEASLLLETFDVDAPVVEV
jgi:hypothetical protein